MPCISIAPVQAPTVVLESGHGEAFTVWGRCSQGFPKVTRTCSYDRAGFGWSADQPGERDATHIVDQLHGLLESAGITDPVVLAGHSAGGLYANGVRSDVPGRGGCSRSGRRHFAISIASASDTCVPRRAQRCGSFLWSKPWLHWVLRARWPMRCGSTGPGILCRLDQADACHYPQLDVYVREDKALGRSRAEAATVKSLGNVPVLVISQDPDTDIPHS